MGGDGSQAISVELKEPGAYLYVPGGYDNTDGDWLDKQIEGVRSGDISDKGMTWHGIASTLAQVETHLRNALEKAHQANWRGDTADAAVTNLTELHTTAGNLAQTSAKLSTGMVGIAESFSYAQSHGRDDPDARYQRLIDDINHKGLDPIPEGTTVYLPDNSDYSGRGGQNPGPSSPHIPNSGGLPGPGQLPGSGPGGVPGGPHIVDPSLPHGPGTGHLPGPGAGPGGGGPGGVGSGVPGGIGVGSGSPGSGGPGFGGPGAGGVSGFGPGSTGSSLAGFDGGTGSGAALHAGGLGGGGLSGGLNAGGPGAGGVGGGVPGGLAGEITNGGGIAGGSPGRTGPAFGSAMTGGGAGGTAAMMPMRGSSGGNDSERERSTWLSEDDDVWGASDAPPAVIS